jgi:hypothetical protein
MTDKPHTKSLTVLYHRSTQEAAEQILTSGFRDGEGAYMITNWYRGVWLCDRPLDANEGAKEDTLLRVVACSQKYIARWEWVAEGKPYRERLVPSRIVNRLRQSRSIWKRTSGSQRQRDHRTCKPCREQQRADHALPPLPAGSALSPLSALAEPWEVVTSLLVIRTGTNFAQFDYDLITTSKPDTIEPRISFAPAFLGLQHSKCTGYQRIYTV